jgi:hypothetical protein
MVAVFLACCHIPTAMNVVSQQCHSIGKALIYKKVIVFQSAQSSDGEWLVLAAEDLARIKLRQELARI